MSQTESAGALWAGKGAQQVQPMHGCFHWRGEGMERRRRRGAGFTPEFWSGSCTSVSMAPSQCSSSGSGQFLCHPIFYGLK